MSSVAHASTHFAIDCTCRLPSKISSGNTARNAPWPDAYALCPTFPNVNWPGRNGLGAAGLERVRRPPTMDEHRYLPCLTRSRFVLSHLFAAAVRSVIPSQLSFLLWKSSASDNTSLTTPETRLNYPDPSESYLGSSLSRDKVVDTHKRRVSLRRSQGSEHKADPATTILDCRKSGMRRQSVDRGAARNDRICRFGIDVC